ncbi:phosphotransferase system component [Seminavis robusta]|uniref:Phosphotransferase system component n=1 Tax=Seminavis robusta TaxID=568900 RepID=A0A9N8HGW7_9STRA|nr:phosphotransferase system component [Seminavis robusta]|eukprot:Sro665_g183820.1 phosphotransferase system component (887) ;mRNA; r:18348-21350
MSAAPGVVDQERLVCRLCQHRGSDVQFKGCGCTLHARCVPLCLIIGEGNPLQPLQEGVPPPMQSTNIPCPVCKSGIVGGMYLFPLSLNVLDRAVELRKKVARAAARASSSNSTNANGKRQRELDSGFHEVQAESSYLLLSHTRSSLTSTMSMETDLHRTGRWTAEEIGYVDLLLNTFDRGMLNLPHGIKLNEFLGEVLLCKSSRLTKKMKNARLSTRSYALRPPMPGAELLDTVVMSRLQDKFVQSLSNESTQLEVLFNLTKLWRTHFSNLCLQVGYQLLDASDWVSSLEDMERRASQAEEMIRKARRKRMGLALKTDVRTPNPGVFFANRPVQGRENTIIPPRAPQSIPNTISAATVIPPATISKDMFENEKHSVSSEEASDADFIAHMLELSSQPGPDGKRNRLLSMDLEQGNLDDLFEPSSTSSDPQSSKECKAFEHGPFLQELVTFLEKNHLPFGHVDVWVPSFLSEKKEGNQDTSEAKTEEDQLRLYHAGYATRHDVAPIIAAQFNEFGEYSKKFSFAPGVGLPGRVFESGQPSWSTRVHQADPKFFERAGGARIYGVKTVLGIPLTSSIGKLVVAMYTMADIQRNEAVIEKCVQAFSKYSPEPKWRLVVEMGGKGIVPCQAGPAPSIDAAVNDASIDFSGFDMDDFGQAGLSSSSNVALAPTADESMSGATASDSKVVEDEQRIATLLGEYMPLSQLPSSVGEPSGSSTGSADFLNEFMQLRLLLLRPRSRRSTVDNELIDVLRNSFRGYSNGNRRNGSELANLLVKDWRFLKGAASPNTAASGVSGDRRSSMTSTASAMQHQCHVMDAPNLNTYSSSGAPTKPPTSLGFSQPMAAPSRNRMDPLRASFDAAASVQTQRRISVASEVPDSPRSNVVSDSY